MARIRPLTGPNYRTWRKQMEALLRSHDLWDVVSPPPPNDDAAPDDAVPDATPDVSAEEAKALRRELRKKRKQGYWASELIFGYCGPVPLSMVVHHEGPAAQWAFLKLIYSPSLNLLMGGFWEYEPPVGMGVAGMAKKLSEMQEDIEDLSVVERPTDFAKMAALFSTVRRAREGRGEWERWREAEFWIYQSKCGYEDAVKELVKCETTLNAEARKARGARRGNRGGRKRGVH